MSKVAAVNATVLIAGGSGTGKELVARAIHRRSSRAGGPFIAVNCSAIPRDLIEAEFFGYEKGTFTDARESHAGKFEAAAGGTLFLDEVGDLALDAQAKLLRSLQEREIIRVGGKHPIPVDVRVLAATNKDLERAVKNNEFREDLYWRINVVTINLPPLRKRHQDLPLLLDHFLDRFQRELKSETSGKAGGLKTVNRSKRLVRFALKAEPPKKRKSFFICHLPFSIFHLKRRGLGDGLKS